MPASRRAPPGVASGGLRLLAGFALLSLAGCTDAPPPAAVTDLVAQHPEAEAWCETAEIDLGTAAPEPALLGGWGAPSREVNDYLWGAGERSELTFRRADRRAFRLRLRGWAHPRLPEGQDVDLTLNGVALARIRLGSAPQTVEVEVPAGRARPGSNRLALSYPVVVPTGRYGRLLGPAWDGLRFDSAGAAAGAAALPSSGGPIELAAGCGIDFMLEPRRGERLVVSGVEERGRARLAADVECEGEPARSDGLEPLPGGGRELKLRSGPDPAVPCRVSLRAVPGAPPGESGRVRIAAAGLQRQTPPPLGSDAVSPPLPALAAAAEPAPAPPGVLIYLVDALRADRLGPYGGTPGLTPTLDGFASRAVRFDQARAQSSWTRPAVASLFTGLTPLRHGATDLESRLPDEVATLAERLRQHGYRTGYVTANGNTTAAFGFDQGFDFFRWLYAENEMQKVRWPEALAAAREFFDALPAATPWFLVLHTVETHAPYLPSPRQRALGGGRRSAPGRAPDAPRPAGARSK